MVDRAPDADKENKGIACFITSCCNIFNTSTISWYYTTKVCKTINILYWLAFYDEHLHEIDSSSSCWQTNGFFFFYHLIEFICFFSSLHHRLCLIKVTTVCFVEELTWVYLSFSGIRLQLIPEHSRLQRAITSIRIVK